MKIRNLLLLSFLAGIILTSCKKDDDKTDDISSDPFEAEYSDLTITENKENLEQTGLDMLSEISDMQESEAIGVLTNFALTIFSSEMQVSQSEAFYGVMTGLADAKSDDFEVTKVFSDLKAVSEDPNSFTEIWDSIVGTYSWDATVEDWVVTEATDEVVFEFPGMAGETTNTASITIDNFGAFTVTDNSLIDFDGMEPELLSSLNISLEYNSTEVASYSFSASYQNDGMPTAVATEIALGEFSWSVEMTHTPYTEASFKGSFKHSDDVLIEGYIEAGGDWSESNVEANTIDSSGWTEVMVENIIQNSNAYIQIMDIKIAGMIYIDSLATAMEAIEDGDYSDEEAYVTAMAEAINQYALLVVVYAESNEMIAKAVAYPYEDEGYWDIELRFQFADGSPVDAETYFSEGFSEFISEFESLIGDFEGV